MVCWFGLLLCVYKSECCSMLLNAGVLMHVSVRMSSSERHWLVHSLKCLLEVRYRGVEKLWYISVSTIIGRFPGLWKILDRKMLIPVQKVIPVRNPGIPVRKVRCPDWEGSRSGNGREFRLGMQTQFGELASLLFWDIRIEILRDVPPRFCFLGNIPIEENYSVGTPVWRTLGKVNDHDFPIWGYLVTWDMCWKEYAIAAECGAGTTWFGVIGFVLSYEKGQVGVAWCVIYTVTLVPGRVSGL